MIETTQHQVNHNTAIQDFKRARKQAVLQQLMARLTGKSVELLAYDEVHDALQVTGHIDRGLQEIPLESIVGSVGRYKDFTRDFLPRNDSNEERWTRIKTAVLDMKGYPPIEVYQIGDAYFVIDGNHRVSVARQIGNELISAYVTEVQTRISLTVEDKPDEVIAKARYLEFLKDTGLDGLRPECNLLMTFTGQYRLLCSQINWHHDRLTEQQSESVSWETAVSSWYDAVYMPVIKLIREQGLMRNFHKRTETDIYVLMYKHRETLEEALGWDIDTQTAVSDLVAKETKRSKGVVSRVSHMLMDAIIPPELDDGPKPGIWRQQQLDEGKQYRLFEDYLVAISGTEADWKMLDFAINMAKSDGDRLMGLHVVPSKSQIHTPEVEAIRIRFEQQCKDGGIVGKLAIEAGNVTDTIVKRSAFVDLVVTSLTHPPGDQLMARLGNGFSQLVQRCPRPILAIPENSVFKSKPNPMLLAYDGSPKATEALFVATYFAFRWQRKLVVVTVKTDRTSAAALQRAKDYIELHGVHDAEYVLRSKPIADAVLAVANEYQCTELIMGGFGFRPVKHIVLGSTVERVLREFRNPVLICR